MREIAFRGKIKKGENRGQWAYGYYVNSNDGNHWITDGCNGVVVYPKTVGQFTGRKDKLNNEIYEGDLFKEKDEDEIEEVWEICWSGNEARRKKKKGADWPTREDGYVYRGLGIRDLANIEIIENIHDGPELLEDK